MGLLGVHFIPTHTGPHHFEFIRQVKPRLMKTVGGGLPDVQVLSDVFVAAPEAIHYWRDHALSEQHGDLWRDPEGTARRHVAELAAAVDARMAEGKRRGLPMPAREQVRILGINEPVVEQFRRFEDGRNLAEWSAMMAVRTPLLDLYMVTFGRQALAHGLGAGLGNFSSGQPANRVPGAYPTFVTWFSRTAQLLEQQRGRLALAVHEYWTADKGPGGWWDWHTHRFKHFEVDCDIDVLECGVDHGIVGQRLSGWQGRIDAATYAAQMGEYLRRCRTDRRFRGATPFTLDGASEWATFYVEPAAHELVALAHELRREQSHQVHVPVVVVSPPVPAPAAPPQSVRTLDPRVMEAIMAVEAGRRTHDLDGNALIRFEAHIFRRELGNDGLWAQHFRVGEPVWQGQAWRPSVGEAWRAIHTGRQADEYAVLRFAEGLNAEAAYRSISVGAPQIMGFNHARVGYASAREMWQAFTDSVGAQMVAMCNFVLSDSALHAAVNARDWAEIGRRYNGQASAGELYRQAYVRLWGTGG